MRALVRSTLLVAIVLVASAAHAGPGVNLRWDRCFGDGGVQNRSFACDTNAGSETLVCSFVLGEDLPLYLALQIVIDVAAADASLPAWWSFKNAGACRQPSLAVNPTIAATTVNCTDWASGSAAAGIGAYEIGARSPNAARLKLAFAIPATILVDLFKDTEYFSCNVRIDHAKTVGAGACAGCGVPVCIVFNSLKITSFEVAKDRVVSGPANGVDSDFATWQGGGAPVVGVSVGCPAATPTRRSSWGAVKALYR
jgi:hypothetical protein